ncbi:MAG: ABC transporter substrate-binding protein [Desulfobulbaceae bacterium]|uniref:ABC transporter substrate-binding protein n=1 Tax=Candidatus Desulfobia pelagia TaxID=2841692 RepID=A0A8J6NG61_9BACT|nr:ABC transporter substrate-binding protein [Candidatus Desulfobia pelagia]
MKKASLTLITLASILILLIFCQRQNEPIKIGLAVNLSGPGGSAGEHIRDGAMQAVEDINAKGGVKGRPLLLLVRDDLNTAAGVLQADEALMEEGVPVIIGHSQSTNTLTAYPLVTSRNTLLMTAYTSTKQLSGRDDLFVRTAVESNLYGLKTAALLKNKGMKSVAFLIDDVNAVFGNDWLAETRRHFQGALSEVHFNSKEEPHWPKIITELLASDPEAVILMTSSSISAVAAQFVRQQNQAVLLIASLWSQSPELVTVGGKSVEGMTIITFIPSENTRPDYLAFSQRLEANFNKKATPRSARAHELITILADAMGRCKIINALELKAALLAGEYESILGGVKFDRFGDTVRPVYEERIINGVFKTIGEIQ